MLEEWMPLGSLLPVLKRDDPVVCHAQNKLRWAADIALGMEYLSSLGLRAGGFCAVDLFYFILA